MECHLQKTTEEKWKNRIVAANKLACKKLAVGACAAVLLLGGLIFNSGTAYANDGNEYLAAQLEITTVTDTQEDDTNEELVQSVVSSACQQNQAQIVELALEGKELSEEKAKEDAIAAEEAARQAYLESEQGQRERLVEAAKSRLGVPYVYGGTDPDNGMDCSGFVQWCYSQIGIDIPRTSYDQEGSALEVIAVEDAKPGDILSSGGHVGIYIGDGVFIHEPQSGDVCRESSDMGQFYVALRYVESD